MDIIYDVLQFSVNKFLFNYTVNSDTPVFILVFTNPWTAEEKTVTLNTPDGTDGEWIFEIEGVSTLFEDLDQGKIEFEDPGTWRISVSESGNLIKNINLQVIQEEDMGRIKIKELTLTSAQILLLNTTPVELVAAPGAGKAITPMFISGIVDFNSVAYDTQTSVTIRWVTSQALIANMSTILDATAPDKISSEPVSATTKENLNQAIELFVPTADPENGDSPVQFTLIYFEELLS